MSGPRSLAQDAAPQPETGPVSAQNYTGITSEQAENYIKGRAAIEESTLQLRRKYLPIFRKVLSARLTALFFQLDWRLGLIMDLQLSLQTPLIEP